MLQRKGVSEKIRSGRKCGHAGSQPGTKFVIELTEEQLRRPLGLQLFAGPGEDRLGLIFGDSLIAFAARLIVHAIGDQRGHFIFELRIKIVGAVARMTGSAAEVRHLAMRKFRERLALE